MRKKAGILGNILKDNVISFAETLPELGIECGFDFYFDKKLKEKSEKLKCVEILAEDAMSSLDFIISLGGDGFLLTVAKKIYPLQIPVLPVNLGRLGFNSCVMPDELSGFLKKYKESDFPVQNRMLLDAEMIRDESVVFKEIGLNEVIITKEAVSRMVVFEIYADNMPICEVRSDGLIVSTPTGSTAYSLSAGGPVLHPAVDAFVISPICPHSLTHRPVVVPSDFTINIKQRIIKDQEDSIVIVDGHRWTPIKKDDVINVKKAEYPIKIIYENSSKYFSTLKEKLLWGGFPDE